MFTPIGGANIEKDELKFWSRMKFSRVLYTFCHRHLTDSMFHKKKDPSIRGSNK